MMLENFARAGCRFMRALGRKKPSSGSRPNSAVPPSVESLENRLVPASLSLNQRFVAQAYRDLLKREADSGGLHGFVDALDRGKTTRAQVAATILHSPEYLGKQVQILYNSLLHRSPDPAGFNATMAFLQHGGSLAQVRASIASSLEYFKGQGGGSNLGYLKALYRDVLHRNIDTTGQTSFSQALANGTSRDKIVDVIFQSSEARQGTVQGFYNDFLHRQADGAGAKCFVNALQHGATEEQVLATVIASPEYSSKA
jgi:acylphosphatase